VIANARDLLRRKLPPKAYQYVNFCWWIGRHYLPRRAASFFLKKNPKVLGVAGTHALELADTLRRINLVALTTMCHTMLRNGSDKGWGLHNYTTVYSALFDNLRDRPVRFFELGLGSNNPDMPFYMGVNGTPGASLRGWRELFPHALIYGADIDRGILFEEHRIQTFFCDQLDAVAIRDLWSQPALAGQMDIIIDDGHHTFKANTVFLDGSLSRLHPGGIYVVEDIHLSETVSRLRLRTCGAAASFE
jgi:hypothetical protein